MSTTASSGAAREGRPRSTRRGEAIMRSAMTRGKAAHRRADAPTRRRADAPTGERATAETPAALSRRRGSSPHSRGATRRAPANGRRPPNDRSVAQHVWTSGAPREQTQPPNHRAPTRPSADPRGRPAFSASWPRARSRRTAPDRRPVPQSPCNVPWRHRMTGVAQGRAYPPSRVPRRAPSQRRRARRTREAA